MSSGALEIVFWDVQHGCAAFIRTPNGLHIVQDLGTGSYGGDEEFSPLLHLKSKYKVERLDEVIISHPHKDHIQDIMNFEGLNPRVLTRPKHLSREDIMKNVIEEDKELFEKYLEISDRYNQPVVDSQNPNLPANNGGVEIKTFIPSKCATSNINNHSVVTVLSYANSKVILSGDNEPASWKELLEKDDFKTAIAKADILFAPHHGRDSGFCSEIFECFKPYLTVISDGRFCDSSATDRYGKVSQGWTVHNRENGTSEKRNCVTTRSDNVIVVKLGINPDSKPYIHVSTG